MIRSEAERQFYLGAAGIRVWYARQPLPGAATSPEFEFPEEASAAEVLPEIAQPVSDPGGISGKSARPVLSARHRNQGAARIADLQALMENGTEASEKPASEIPEQKSLVEPGRDSPQPEPVNKIAAGVPWTPVGKVNLMLWVGDNIVLIAAMSAEASTRLQEILALNILKSLGEQRPRFLGQVRWPVFNNLLVPGNSTGDLVEVIGNVLSGVDRQKVVLLGGEAETEKDWLTKALGRDVAVSFQYSLAELASEPAIKRSLWHRLKALADR
ncbi:2-isopropylmalate synthase [Marinobacter sp.]|uniref:2-isopropylmalate synthase n=1 Tax=Marinobacter sp. TaxID=50741 RepID=UPI003A92CFC3